MKELLRLFLATWGEAVIRVLGLWALARRVHEVNPALHPL